MNTLAERLKHARLTKQWSQGKLAITAGLTPAAISNIEKGIRQSKGSLPQLAEALGISYKWLAYGEGDIKMDENNPPTQSSNDCDGLSALARSLADLFDTLPANDIALRSRAYGAAAGAILLLKDPPPVALPTPEPTHSQETPKQAYQKPTTRSK